MTWDDTKITGNTLTATEWNNHVTDQKKRQYIGGKTVGFSSSSDYECDGTADDVQIQQAIDALTSGGAIWLAEGTYDITAALEVPSNIAIYGMGKGSTILKQANSTNDNIIEASTAGSSVRGNWVFENFAIDGNMDNNTSGTWYGILGECYYGRFTNLLIHHCRTSTVALLGYSGNGAIENIFTNCTFRDVSQSHTVNCSTYATDNHFINCMFWGATATGSYMLRSQEWNTIVSHCHFYGGTSAGAILFQGGNKYNKVVDCYIENIDRNGVTIDNNSQDCENFIIANNSFTDVGEETNNTYDCIKMDKTASGTLTRGVILGNTIRSGDANKHRYGIYGDETDYMSVVANIVEDAGTANISVAGANSEIAHNIDFS